MWHLLKTLHCNNNNNTSNIFYSKSLQCIDKKIYYLNLSVFHFFYLVLPVTWLLFVKCTSNFWVKMLPMNSYTMFCRLNSHIDQAQVYKWWGENRLYQKTLTPFLSWRHCCRLQSIVRHALDISEKMRRANKSERNMKAWFLLLSGLSPSRDEPLFCRSRWWGAD